LTLAASRDQSAGADYTLSELAIGLLVAVGAQVVGFLLLSSGGGTALKADISDELAKPMSVSITPVVDDAPLLKLGAKRPSKLPDRWVAPKPVERATQTALPSTHAPLNAEAIPKSSVSDAGAKPPPPDAELIKQADLLLPVPDAAAAPASTVLGAADGVKEGTETDPLKAHAIDMYRAQLEQWFAQRFTIRGKIPFETLKDLRARAVISIGGERTVTSFSIQKPSGNDTFDRELESSLAAIVASGAELPSPPEMYPDVLKSSQSITFRCSNRSQCE
jgi:hypothetical protein